MPDYNNPEYNNQHIPVLDDIIPSTDDIERQALKDAQATIDLPDELSAGRDETTATFDDTPAFTSLPDSRQAALPVDLDIEAISEQIIEQLMPDIKQRLHQLIQTVLQEHIANNSPMSGQ